jgi:serine/threonine protein kinase
LTAPQRFIKEGLILQLLKHPNVVTFVGVINEPYKLYIVSAWMKNGDIMAYLQKTPDASRKELVQSLFIASVQRPR